MTKAYNDFYKANYTNVYKWVFSELRDKDESYDLVADIFFKIFEKFSTIENHEHYLNAAVFNAIRNHHASKVNKRKHTSLDEFDPNVFVIESDDYSNPEMNKKAVEVFNKVMLESDEMTREIFKARIMGKVSATEVQNLYSISYNKYNQIIDTTRKKVLDLLSKYEQ